MKLINASASDIAAMNERLNRRKEDRKAELEIDEVLKMVNKHPFVQAPVEVRKDYKEDLFFFNGLNLIILAFVGAILWNITSIKYFIGFFFVTAFMAGIEFMKAFK